MPMYMAQFVYTPEAWAALIHAPQDRVGASAVEQVTLQKRH